MTIHENLKQSVAEGDVIHARAIILRKINADRDQVHFGSTEYCRYANNELKKLSKSLFDQDDEKTKISEPKSSWNKELWENLRVEFEYNFSERKFDYIIEIMKFLREQGHSDFTIRGEKPENSTKTTTTNSKSTNRSRPGTSGNNKSEQTQKSQADIFIDDLSVHREISLRHQQTEEPKSEEPKSETTYIKTGLAGAVLGGFLGNLFRLTIPGVVIGAVIGAGVVLLKKKSKD